MFSFPPERETHTYHFKINEIQRLRIGNISFIMHFTECIPLASVQESWNWSDRAQSMCTNMLTNSNRYK